MRSIRGYSVITQNQGYLHRTFHSIQWSFQRRLRNGFSFGFNDVMGISDHQNLAPRLQHAADGTFSVRSDQAEAQRLLGNNNPRANVMKANFVWDLPDLHATGDVMKAVGLVINDWRLSGIWTGSTGSAYAVSASYQSGGSNVNVTGSPDYGGRVYVVVTTRMCNSIPQRSRGRRSAASGSSPATATCVAASRARSMCRSRGTSGSGAVGA
jgi:hypothetical protein